MVVLISYMALSRGMFVPFLLFGGNNSDLLRNWKDVTDTLTTFTAT